MHWYRVQFDATRSDPKTYVRKVTIDQKLQAESPLDAIEKAVYLTFGHGEVESRVLDGDVWIPVEWMFIDEESPYGDWSFKLWIDEDAAELSKMVTELAPDEQLRLMGVPGLFDEAATIGGER